MNIMKSFCSKKDAFSKYVNMDKLNYVQNNIVRMKNGPVKAGRGNKNV